MYTSAQLAKKYIRYYLSASNGKGHGTHSPFVFDFILNVLNNKSNYHPPEAIERLRKELLQNNTILQIEDLGAGSRTMHFKQRSIKQLAGTALKPKKLAQLFFRLVCHYQPQTIVELGTSLGITTAYLASGNPSAQIISVEGSKAIADVAMSGFKKLGLHHIQSVVGNFDDVLPGIVNDYSAIDLAFIDGNHRYQPTINYFEQLLTRSHKNTILVFDDIYWSAEMEKAWAEIKQHPSVQYSIDIFFLGFVFFKNEFKEKQHFKIRY